MKVLKFGGTSMGSVESIKKVYDIIYKQMQSDKLLVVVSAMSVVTDKLLHMAKLAQEKNKQYKSLLKELEDKHISTAKDILNGDILNESKKYIQGLFRNISDNLQGVFLLGELSKSSKDKISCLGEYLSSHILYSLFKEKGIESNLLDSKEYIIGEYNNNNLKLNYKQSYEKIDAIHNLENSLTIVPGFVGSNGKRQTITLGRGGSDYSAALYAAGLKASALEIWTDVDGIFTADPRMVSNSYPIEHLSFQEALELSHFGAKVIYPPTMHPVLSNNISVNVRNTFNPENKGTIISSNPEKGDKLIKGLSSIPNISLISLSGSGMVGVAGISSRFFSALAKESVNVILITQASSEHSICIAVKSNDSKRAEKTLMQEFKYELSVNKVNKIKNEDGYAIISLVGENMNKTKGISGKAFSALGKNGINIHAIAQGSSELNISMVIKQEETRKSLNVLHEEFFLSKFKTINLYIAGVGNVGGKLLQIIKDQEHYLKEKKGIDLRIKGISNSRKMVFKQDGVSLQKWNEILDQGEKADICEFVDKVKNDNFRNSIFVDNTANEEVSKVYAKLLDSSISIATCNKIAASSKFSVYSQLKDSSRKKNVQFLFESNVGAGLPIINTINNLKTSGDEILKIEGVLSGSVNFILNEFFDGKSLRKSVEAAMEAGYTEPDPRIDLSGMDVARKILILAREAGYELEPEEINVEKFLPQSCFDATNVDDFLNELEKIEDLLIELRDKAKAANKKLRFIACYDKSFAKVSLEQVGQESPFYNIEGKDNLVVIYTQWYYNQPLIIKGAGAGAEVTASGIMADIMQIAGNGLLN